MWWNWAAVSCDTTTGAEIMWLRYANPPNVHSMPLHHVARHYPSRGCPIARPWLPPFGQLWCVPLHLQQVHVRDVVERPDHFVIPTVKNWFPLVHVGPHSPLENNPFTIVYPRPSP